MIKEPVSLIYIRAGADELMCSHVWVCFCLFRIACLERGPTVTAHILMRGYYRSYLREAQFYNRVLAFNIWRVSSSGYKGHSAMFKENHFYFPSVHSTHLFSSTYFCDISISHCFICSVILAIATYGNYPVLLFIPNKPPPMISQGRSNRHKHCSGSVFGSLIKSLIVSLIYMKELVTDYHLNVFLCWTTGSGHE